jgi:hypothetical protein
MHGMRPRGKDGASGAASKGISFEALAFQPIGLHPPEADETAHPLIGHYRHAVDRADQSTYLVLRMFTPGATVNILVKWQTWELWI